MYRQNYPNDPGMHNNMDSHTRTSYRRNPTFFERVGSSLFGILAGIALLVAGSGLLFWNEGRAVQTSKSLDEGLSIVQSLRTSEVAFEENSGKLIYLSGGLKTKEVLTDTLYDVSISAVKLKRQVEMYQWVEQEHKREVNEGSHTKEDITYSYSQEWRSDLVRSSSFDNTVGHHNPSEFAVQPKEYVASGVWVGAFELSKGLVEKINQYKDIEASSPSLQPGVQLYMGYYYHGNDPLRPQVGDLKVKFSYAGLSHSGDQEKTSAEADMVSIIAKQKHNQLEQYETQAGDILELLYYGEVSPKEIFGKEHAHNTFITWAIRLGGWLLMFVGFGCVTRIIAVLVDWLPIVRELVAMGMHMMNLALSISLSLTVIAIGWIRYRPLLGIAILVMASTPFILSKLRVRHNQSSHRNV
ncbi:transmembrane protein 43-like [Liolophura sinensis]|uniref:transmembrane protein 43-like n=1 Tax=Liolophura sinensis TaxID=3198878 RepID=UPI0031585B20